MLLGSLHAAEHAQIAVLPLLAMCDRWDIGGLSTNYHPQTGGPTIFIYDGHPGGVGITRQGFLRFETLVADAHRLIAECPCERRLPVVRAVAEVRQPQRAAGEGGRAASCWRGCSSAEDHMTDPTPLHQATPVELKARLAAERAGHPFLLYADDAGRQQIVVLDAERQGRIDRRRAARRST